MIQKTFSCSKLLNTKCIATQAISKTTDIVPENKGRTKISGRNRIKIKEDTAPYPFAYDE